MAASLKYKTDSQERDHVAVADWQRSQCGHWCTGTFVERCYPAFLSQLAAAGTALTPYVEQEFEEYL